MLKYIIISLLIIANAIMFITVPPHISTVNFLLFFLFMLLAIITLCFGATVSGSTNRSKSSTSRS